MLREFRDFTLRGNIVELAVAFVLGVAFGALITSFVDNLLMPIVAMIFGKQDFSALTFTINDAVFRYGAFLTDAIIVQRYIEVDSRLRRVMAVVKVRSSDHSDELREYSIGADGIEVGQTLPDQEGLLGGRPTTKRGKKVSDNGGG